MAVTLRYEDGTMAVFASVAEALAQAGHDEVQNYRKPVDVVEGEPYGGSLPTERDFFSTTEDAPPTEAPFPDKVKKLAGRRQISTAAKKREKEILALGHERPWDLPGKGGQ